jgi:hypothetical protein
MLMLFESFRSLLNFLQLAHLSPPSLTSSGLPIGLLLLIIHYLSGSDNGVLSLDDVLRADTAATLAFAAKVDEHSPRGIIPNGDGFAPAVGTVACLVFPLLGNHASSFSIL